MVLMNANDTYSPPLRHGDALVVVSTYVRSTDVIVVVRLLGESALPPNKREHHLESPNRRSGWQQAILIDDPGRENQHWRIAPSLDVVQGTLHREDHRSSHREVSYTLFNVACPGDDLGQGCPTLNLTRRTRQGDTTVRTAGCGAGPRPRCTGRGFGQGIIHNGSHEVIRAVVAHCDRQRQFLTRQLVVLTDMGVNVCWDCGWYHGCSYRRAGCRRGRGRCTGRRRGCSRDARR